MLLLLLMLLLLWWLWWHVWLAGYGRALLLVWLLSCAWRGLGKRGRIRLLRRLKLTLLRRLPLVHGLLLCITLLLLLLLLWSKWWWGHVALRVWLWLLRHGLLEAAGLLRLLPKALL